MTTRESVMRALTVRRFNGCRFTGAPRFNWVGFANPQGVCFIIGQGGTRTLKSWSEVESCVASMIAAQPSVAKVL